MENEVFAQICFLKAHFRDGCTVSCKAYDAIHPPGLCSTVINLSDMKVDERSIFDCDENEFTLSPPPVVIDDCTESYVVSRAVLRQHVRRAMTEILAMGLQKRAGSQSSLRRHFIDSTFGETRLLELIADFVI